MCVCYVCVCVFVCVLWTVLCSFRTNTALMEYGWWMKSAGKHSPTNWKTLVNVKLKRWFWTTTKRKFTNNFYFSSLIYRENPEIEWNMHISKIGFFEFKTEQLEGTHGKTTDLLLNSFYFVEKNFYENHNWWKKKEETKETREKRRKSIGDTTWIEMYFGWKFSSSFFVMCHFHHPYNEIQNMLCRFCALQISLSVFFRYLYANHQYWMVFGCDVVTKVTTMFCFIFQKTKTKQTTKNWDKNHSTLKWIPFTNPLHYRVYSMYGICVHITTEDGDDGSNSNYDAFIDFGPVWRKNNWQPHCTYLYKYELVPEISSDSRRIWLHWIGLFSSFFGFVFGPMT